MRLVVTPEKMVIDEARRAFTDLSLFELSADAVVMNRRAPRPGGRGGVLSRLGAACRASVSKKCAAIFAPLEVLLAPLQDDEVIGLDRLSAHAAALFGARDPTALLGESSRIRFDRVDRGYRVRIPLPGASSADLDVSVVEDELIIRAGSRRRVCPARSDRGKHARGRPAARG